MTEIEDIYGYDGDRSSLVNIIEDLLQMDVSKYCDNQAFNKTMINLRRKYRASPSKHVLGLIYTELFLQDPVRYPMVTELKNILITRAIRSDSGILNISISLPPHKFSCRHNCFFCPNEPGMPRSYLSNEHVFKQASAVNFDTVQQIKSRLDTLKSNGHPIDKIEYRVLGGTFSCYPHDITDEFVRDCYYAANIYGETSPRAVLTLDEEQTLNTVAGVHVVGFGIETRPDEINEAEIVRFRYYGVTRVELGIQHTDDRLLKLVNRGHGVEQSRKAIKLLKDYGFKVEIHIMTDLPGATPDGDKECYRLILRDDPDLIPDYLKDYPCLDVSYTVIKRWKECGEWQPYAEKTPDAHDLKEVLIYRQQITPKWVRVNRIQRDFLLANETPDHLGYTSDGIKSNLGQIVKTEAEARDIYCQCIRCREIRNEKFDPSEIKFMTETFTANGGQEYFISAEIQREHRNLLLGFIRLRLSNALQSSIIPELLGKTAMIRELHVYGRLKEVGKTDQLHGAQHLGIGKQLLVMAEKIALDQQQEKMAIISGIGVRDYYRKNGYQLVGTYMVKHFK
jgi:ELP3 family radical SAM enzyme/protein acetyltransferase